MICYILVRKWTNPMTGEVWADEPIPQPARDGQKLLHPLQGALNTKPAPQAVGQKAVISGHWQKVGEFDDGTVPADTERPNWKAMGAVVTANPPGGPALKIPEAKAPKAAPVAKP